MQRRQVPLGDADIRKSLNNFGEFRSDVLLVHSSLSACGQILGGPQTVIRALLEWVGRGSLVMPTHTYCYPTDGGQSPIFSKDRTPSSVGAITERFRNFPGVVRSNNPSHSVACIGPMAQELCGDNDLLETPCGFGTPYARLVANNCAVLLFGVTLDSYTLFHTAEDEAGVPYQYLPILCRFLVQDGPSSTRTLSLKRQDMNVIRRFEAMDSWLEDRKLLRRHALGRGELLFIPSAAAVHTALVAQLKDDPFFLVSEQGRDYFARQGGAATDISVGFVSKAVPRSSSSYPK